MIESSELDRITAAANIIFRSDYFTLDRLATTLATTQSPGIPDISASPGITSPPVPTAPVTSTPAFDKFKKCWEKFNADLIACGGPSRLALFRCLGTANPSLAQATRCAEVADSVSRQCMAKQLAKFNLCVQQEITRDDVIEERLARQLDRANSEARSKPKSTSAQAKNGVAIAGGVVGLAGLVIKAREAKLSPGAGVSLSVAGSYLGVVGGLTAVVGAALAAVDPPRGDFRRVDIVGSAENTLPTPKNDLEGALRDLIPALLTYGRAVAAVTKATERLDGLRAAQNPDCRTCSPSMIRLVRSRLTRAWPLSPSNRQRVPTYS